MVEVPREQQGEATGGGQELPEALRVAVSAHLPQNCCQWPVQDCALNTSVTPPRQMTTLLTQALCGLSSQWVQGSCSACASFCGPCLQVVQQRACRLRAGRLCPVAGHALHGEPLPMRDVQAVGSHGQNQLRVVWALLTGIVPHVLHIIALSDGCQGIDAVTCAALALRLRPSPVGPVPRAVRLLSAL